MRAFYDIVLCNLAGAVSQKALSHLHTCCCENFKSQITTNDAKLQYFRVEYTLPVLFLVSG
jgi:hypothetical protein